MTLRFRRGRLRERQLCGREPVRRRLFSQAGLGEMMRDDGGRTFLVAGALLQRLRYIRMNALTPAAQQRNIRGVLHQRVLENVGRLGRRAAAINQFGFHELAQGVQQCLSGDRRYRFQQIIGELAPDRRPDLSDLLDG